MRKPPFEQFEQFERLFDDINRQEGLRQQIIPYFISSHPGCREEDMVNLAIATKRLDFQLEQIQDFTPTPMTISTEMWYTGYDPYTMQPVFSAKTPREKLAQRMFFFWYKPEERQGIERELRYLGMEHLIPALLGNVRNKYPGKNVEKGEKSYSGNPREGRHPKTAPYAKHQDYRKADRREAQPRNVRRRHRGDR
jgi:hypothetical protein